VPLGFNGVGKDFEQGHLCRGYYLNPKKSAAFILGITQLLNAFSLWFLEHRLRRLRWRKFRLCLLWVRGGQLAVVLFEGVKVWLLGEGFYSEVFWVGQLVNGGTDSFVMDWIKLVVDIPCKRVWSPLLFADSPSFSYGPLLVLRTRTIRCSGPSVLILFKLFTSLSLSTWMGRSDRGWWIVRTFRLESAVVFVLGLEDVPLCQEWYLLVKEVEEVALECPVADGELYSFVGVRSYEQAKAALFFQFRVGVLLRAVSWRNT